MNTSVASHLQIFFYFNSLDPLRKYNKEDIVLQLPGEWTIFGIDWFSIFDVESKENYGSVIIPDGLNVPPSLVKVVVCIKITWTCNIILV
jgi:hypothetical protein